MNELATEIRTLEEIAGRIAAEGGRPIVGIDPQTMDTPLVRLATYVADQVRIKRVRMRVIANKEARQAREFVGAVL